MHNFYPAGLDNLMLMLEQLSDSVHHLLLLVSLQLRIVNCPVCLMFYSLANKEERLSASRMG